MNYVKSCLIITMLLGVGYSQDCDPEADFGWNCDCNEDTWQIFYYPNMEGCYLQEAYLVEVNLAGVNLAGANLAGANLAGANFVNANLAGANLSGADLAGAIFVSANLEGASLFWTNLLQANLDWANLYEADLRGAILDEVNFVNANLCNLTGSPSGDVCEQPDGITDNNGDGYDDVSYDAGATSGDLNLDGGNDVLDVVMLIDIIINP